MSNFKGLIFLITFISFNIYAADFAINSQPSEVEIYIAGDASEKPVLLGKTPFKQNLDLLIQTYVKKNQFILTLKKKGYENYNVLFTKTKSL